MKLLATDYHRNGNFGEGFHVHLIRHTDGTVKVCVDFGGMKFAVLQVDKLAAGDIKFGSNSWRGDNFCDAVRKLAGKEGGL